MHSYTSTKKEVLDKHGLFAEGEYKSNTYMRIGFRLNYFQSLKVTIRTKSQATAIKRICDKARRRI
jgi:hypothetical protein